MTKSLIFVLLGLVTVSLAGSLNDQLVQAEKSVKIARRISRCMKKTAKALFTPSNDISIIVLNRTYHRDLVQQTLEGTFDDRIVKIFTKIPDHSNNTPPTFIRESSFVLIDDKSNLLQHLEHSFVSRWMEYIIITEASTKWLSEFAYNLWNLGYVKVAFVSVSSIGEDTLFRLVRDRYSRSSTPIQASYCLCSGVSSHSGKNDQDTSTYPFSSLTHIPINATLKFAKILEGTGQKTDFSRYRSDGTLTNLGVDMMEIFATKYNIELIRYEWMKQNESQWMDAMLRCVADEFDFFYSPLPPPYRNFSRGLLDAVSWYKFETLVFVDSVKFTLQPLLGLLMPYDVYIWICIFVLLALFSVFISVIHILHSRGLLHERINVLDMWSIFVVQPLPDADVPTRFSLRFVFGMWTLHNFATSTLYTATFSSALTTSYGSILLSTFQDILDSGRPVCLGATVKELFDDRNDPQLFAIHNRSEIIFPKDAFGKILNEGYISSRHLSYVDQYNWINRGNDSLRLYSLAEAVILKYPSFYYAKRHHPYSNEFDRIISIARDAGFIGYLKDLYTMAPEKTNDEMGVYTTSGTFLQLKHLTFMFYILVISHVVSGFVFLIEFYMHERSGN